jgi:hypothetical protein
MAVIPAAGIVISHAIRMLTAVIHRTPRIRFAAPAPMMAEETTCVVLTGNPDKLAEYMIMAALKSAAKPLAGLI